MLLAVSSGLSCTKFEKLTNKLKPANGTIAKYSAPEILAFLFKENS
jgi:hypothetical protein